MKKVTEIMAAIFPIIIGFIGIIFKTVNVNITMYLSCNSNIIFVNDTHVGISFLINIYDVNDIKRYQNPAS